MRVAMIGTGYVGLVSGACLADFGHHVVCVDKDAGKIEKLKRGEIPIYEPGLHELVGANAGQGRLKFTTNLGETVRDAEAVFIAVGTPSRRGDGHADLAYVYDAARGIAAALEGFTVVIVKSTVPVGTGDEVERIIAEAAPEKDAAVVSNPEFLREGAAVYDFKHPDRIVVGEVRGREALDLLKAWGTGHPGGIATIHAGSARGALTRLEQLIQEVVVTVPRALVAETVDVIVFIAGRGRSRRVEDIAQVIGLDADGYRLTSVSPSLGASS